MERVAGGGPLFPACRTPGGTAGMHPMKRSLATALAFALSLLGPALVRAQSRVTGADLDGVVRDETGAMVAGVSVTAVNVDTAVARTTVTDSAGRYLLPAMTPG